MMRCIMRCLRGGSDGGPLPAAEHTVIGRGDALSCDDILAEEEASIVNAKVEDAEQFAGEEAEPIARRLPSVERVDPSPAEEEPFKVLPGAVATATAVVEPLAPPPGPAHPASEAEPAAPLESDSLLDASADVFGLATLGLGDDEPAVDLSNLSGTWLMKSVEGDFEELLQEWGIAPRMRQSAARRKYGAGRLKNQIEQAEATVSVRVFGDGKDETQLYEVGVEAVQPDGKTVLTSWESDTFCCQVLLPGTKQVHLTTRRFLRDANTLCEQMTTRGEVTVARIFERQ